MKQGIMEGERGPKFDGCGGLGVSHTNSSHDDDDGGGGGGGGGEGAMPTIDASSRIIHSAAFVYILDCLCWSVIYLSCRRNQPHDIPFTRCCHVRSNRS